MEFDPLRRRTLSELKSAPRLKLTLKTIDGRVEEVILPSNIFVGDLPNFIKNYKKVLTFKAIVVSPLYRPMLLRNLQTLEDAKLKSNDIILIFPQRDIQDLPDSSYEPSPTLSEINAVIEQERETRRSQGLELPDNSGRPESFHNQLKHPSRIPWVSEANPAYIQQLVAMGFDEHRVRTALRVTRNNLEVAADWLLDVRRPSDQQEQSNGPAESSENPRNPDVGSSSGNPSQRNLLEPVAPGARGAPNSPSYAPHLDGIQPVRSSRSLVVTEAVEAFRRQGYSTERIRQAYTEMRENPNAMYRYLDDPVIGPILRRMMTGDGNTQV